MSSGPTNPVRLAANKALVAKMQALIDRGHSKYDIAHVAERIAQESDDGRFYRGGPPQAVGAITKIMTGKQQTFESWAFEAFDKAVHTLELTNGTVPRTPAPDPLPTPPPPTPPTPARTQGLGMRLIEAYINRDDEEFMRIAVEVEKVCG